MRAPNPPRRRALQGLGAVALLLSQADIAFGASIVAVRLWPAADYTRLTLESDAPLVARHFSTDNPARLVVDIDGLELSATLRELVGKVQTDDPFIAGVRIGQNQPRTVRLVLDLKQAVAPQQFTLAPVAAYRHRLVFDLYPTQATDPLLTLIQERERAQAQAAQAVRDALGDFIGSLPAALPSTAPTVSTTTPPALPGLPALPAVSAASAPARPASNPGLMAATPPLAADEQLRLNRLVVVALDPGHGGALIGLVEPPPASATECVACSGYQIAAAAADPRRSRPYSLTKKGRGW